MTPRRVGPRSPRGLHADRAAGGHRDHRRPDRPAPARRPGGARGRQALAVRQQPDAARDRAAQLRVGPRGASPRRREPRRPDRRSPAGLPLRLDRPGPAPPGREQHLRSPEFRLRRLRPRQRHRTRGRLERAALPLRHRPDPVDRGSPEPRRRDHRGGPGGGPSRARRSSPASRATRPATTTSRRRSPRTTRASSSSTARCARRHQGRPRADDLRRREAPWSATSAGPPARGRPCGTPARGSTPRPRSARPARSAASAASTPAGPTSPSATARSAS